MKKNLNYYMNLPYKIEIEPIQANEGGGFCARILQFGMSIVADGETAHEAFENLKDFQKIQFKKYLSEGLEIPEPDTGMEAYSGRILARIPKYLHRDLVIAAKKNGVSLNQYIVSLLAMRSKAKIVQPVR